MSKVKSEAIPDPFAHWQKRTAPSIEPSVRPGVDCSVEPSMTDQSQAEACDVNRIVDSFLKTGILPGVDVERVYADFTDAPTFHEAMNIVTNAQHQFASLDAKVRKRFGNDPANFLEFVNDPSNVEEMVKLGLATARVNPPSPASPEATSSVSGASKERKPPAKTPKGENDAE